VRGAGARDGGVAVTFFGVRGSTPCNGAEVARYGGNTSCVGVDVPGEPPLTFDLGTGLRYFGATCRHDGEFRGNSLVTHLHWDHIQGLPFFTPLLCGSGQLDVWAPAQEAGRTVADVFAEAVCPPVFPVSLADLPGEIRYHDVVDGELELGSIDVMARTVPHCGPTLGYRVEWRGRSVAYISDHQQPTDGGFSIAPGALELARGADLLIHDSQYTVGEFAKKSTWGHCTVDYAVWLAAEAGVRTLALFHHDPTRDDDALDDVLRCASMFARRAGVDVVAAAEGMTIRLP